MAALNIEFLSHLNLIHHNNLCNNVMPNEIAEESRELRNPRRSFVRPV